MKHTENQSPRVSAHGWVWRLLVPQPLAGLDLAPVAAGLQILAGIAVTLPLALALAMPESYRDRGIVMELIAAAVAVPTILMARRGRVVGAGIVALAGTWVAFTLACATASGIHNPAFNGYIVIIAGTGLLLGRRAAYTAVGASLASGLVLLAMDAGGFIPYRAYTPAAVWVFNATYFVMAAAVLSLATRQVTSLSALAQRESAERRQTEAQLLESEERFHRLADAAREGIVFSEHGVVIDANQQLAALLGYEMREMAGRPVRDFIAPESLELVTARIRAGIEEPYRHLLLRKDGVRVEVESRARTVPFEGRPIRVTVLRDITAELAAEAERRQLQKMETIGRLAGGVAHDFNNLLSPILGYAELMLDDLPAEHPHHESVVVIHAAADRARHLTQQLLAFGRKQVIEIRPVNLSQVVRDFERILRRTIREDIEIVIKLFPEPAIVEGDARQIEQILMNLAVNAQDAMPHGGHLSIEVAGDTLSEQEPSLFVDAPVGSRVRLTVGDTGTGIDSSIIPQIFEPFFTTKETGRGTGLGLSTVHGIVTQLHGHIRVDSVVDVGTKFHIYLPRFDGVAAPAALAAEATTPQTGHETVVVAEDNDMVRGFVCGALRRRGYIVIEVAQPEQCLALLKAQEATPDLLLTDVVMPKMNGQQLYRALSAMHPGLKVVYMSGYLGDVIGTKGVVGPGVNFIQKPFSVEALVTKVRDALES